MSLHNSKDYKIPILSELSQISELDGLLTGPGLIADIMSVKATAKTGKMYLLFTKEIEKVEEHFNASDQWEALNTRELFDCLYRRLDDEAAIGVCDPSTRLPRNIRMETIVTSSHDCLLRLDGKVSREDDLLRGVSLPGEVGWSAFIQKYPAYKSVFYNQVQMTAKGLARMGFSLDEKLLKDIYLYRCALQYEEPSSELWRGFLEEFPTERVTQVV